MKKTNKVIFIGISFLAVLLASFSDVAQTGGKNTLKICVESLIPGLFPFMVLGNLLVSCGGGNILGKLFSGITKKAFRLSGACSLPIIVGLVSGFPVGAAVAAEQVRKGEISADEGERVLCFCNNPSPAFILSTVPCMLGCGGNSGVVLWLSIMFSAIISGLCFGRGSGGCKAISIRNSAENGAECIVNSIKKAVESMVNVCGFVIFFSVVTSVLAEGVTLIPGVNKSLVPMFMGGILETATGCFNLSETHFGPMFKLPVAAMFMGWSGLSVHAQVASAVKGSEITLKRYFRAKLLQAVTAPVITVFLMKIIPLSVPTAYITTTDPAIMVFTWTFMAVILLMGCGVIIFSSFSQNKSQVKR